ncbi:MAG: transglycosylase SLT domain-containing protein [Opitutaceae bacterium]
MAAAALLFGGCSPGAGNTAADQPGTLAARRQIWSAIEPMANARGLDPLFVYALVQAESRFNPRAKHGENCGLLQIKPRAWKAVTRVPFETGVWDWRMNLAVGMDGLKSLKEVLTQRGVFSYPMLWAAYHYGLDYTAEHGFDMSRIPRPSDRVSSKLWSGEIHPSVPPK